MDTQESTTTFSNYYDEHFRELRCNAGEELRWAMIYRSLIKSYPGSLPKDLTILDFGCGAGWLSNKLQTFGNVTGVDFSKASVLEAKRQYPNIDFRTMDITSNEINTLGRVSFDLIVSSEVMEHITDHTLFVNQLSLLLKAGGTLLLTTPNGRWYNEYFSADMLPYKQPIENWVAGNKLKTLFEKQFTDIAIKTFYVNWMYSSKKSILIKILANNYLRVALVKTGSFNNYLRLLERFGCGLYLMVSAKKHI